MAEWMIRFNTKGRAICGCVVTEYSNGWEVDLCARHRGGLNADLLAALELIAREGGYKPTDDELDGEDGRHYLQILGRWDAGERARAAIARARGIELKA